MLWRNHGKLLSSAEYVALLLLLLNNILVNNMEVLNIENAIESSNHEFSTLGVFDIDGVFRGKKISKSKLLRSLESGIGFSDVIFGWDINDCVYDNCAVSSVKTGFSDVPVMADLSTFRKNMLGNGEPLLIGEFSGRLLSCCPRSLLKSVTNKFLQMGMSSQISCEFEFMLLDETPITLRNKNFSDLNPVQSSLHAYSILDAPYIHEFVNRLTDSCGEMNIPLIGLHPESGVGVFEAAISHTNALVSADNASLFKQVAKFVAMKQGWTASFMPKLLSDLPGQGGHIHLSLVDINGDSLFYDEAEPNNMSRLMRYFIGGVLKLMPELMCMSVPTVNGYRRLVPEYWAPTVSSCGIENRTCSVRVIGSSPTTLHIEYRLPGADMNPYVAISSLLGAGLWGIENKVDPSFSFSTCGTKMECLSMSKLSTNLEDATRLLQGSIIAREIFGNEFIEHFVMSRQWEVKQYRQYMKEVSSWEVERYLEKI